MHQSHYNCKLFTTVAEIRQALAPLRREGKKIGLVPTMGALHEGHLSLVRESRAQCDATVVWIYVNPSQFGPREDLSKYPRTLQSDLDALEREGTDFVLAPSDSEVYAPGHSTWVEVGEAAELLEGQCRPGHFRGVATVVLKMFNMIQPDVAYFGHKDYQQTLVVRRMTADLNVPVEIRVCPTVREPDGLAMSSRNAYLSPNARRQAPVLWQSLELAARLAAEGETDAAAVARQMKELILTADSQIDYIALVDPETLEPVDSIVAPTLVALAVKIENTRLIDNRIIAPCTRHSSTSR
jgi:pantoate--beta-alanine ligase